MYLPTPTTLVVNPTQFTQALTTPATPTTLTTRDHANPFSIFTPPTTTTEPTNLQSTRRRIVWQTPNVVMDDIPTTLVTVVVATTTAHATRWVTLPAESKSTTTATNALLAATTAAQHAAGTPAAELAEVGEGIPDWPPLLVIFLLCWVVVAWVVAGVLYLATFTEQVAGLDRLLNKWRGTGRGEGERQGRREHSAGQAASEQAAAGATATGLGISFARERSSPRLRRPRSFDSKSLGIRDSRALYGGLAATAPLHSNGSFKMLSADPSPTRADTEREHHQEDLESGKPEVRGGDGRSKDREQPEVGGIAGVLESINVLIDFVARNLARMASDRVDDGAERGLLFPVRNEEREVAGGVV